MRKFTLAALVLACLSASTQAGPIFDNLIVTGAANPDPLGGNTLQDQSRGGIISAAGSAALGIAPGGFVSSTALSAGYALATGDIVFGFLDISKNSAPGGKVVPAGSQLDALYSLKVTGVTPPPNLSATNPASAIVSFAANTGNAFDLASILSASMKGQPGVVVDGTTGVALIEGKFTDPTTFTAVNGSALDVMKALGGTYAGADAGLLGVNAAAKLVDLTTHDAAADSFFQDAITEFGGGSPGTQFGAIYSGANIQSNTSGAVLTANVGSTLLGGWGGVQNQLTGVHTAADFGVTISGGALFFSNSDNWSFSDNASANIRATGFVPEPASMIVWSVMAAGVGLVARRRRKNSA